MELGSRCLESAGDERPGAHGRADLSRPDPVHDAGCLVHLGHQHAVPARRRPRQHAGLHGQRVLHGRPGAVRGPDRCGRRHPRPSVLVPAGRGDAPGLDPPVPGHVAGPGRASRVGDRLDPARPRFHVFLGRDRGVAGRRAQGDGLPRHARVGLRQGADRVRRRDADRLGRGWRRGPGHQPRRSVPAPGRRSSG